MKVVAIIDAPDDVPVEQMQIIGKIYKGRSGFREWIGSFGKLKVRKLPEKKAVNFFEYWYKEGWNDCLYEIGAEDETD